MTDSRKTAARRSRSTDGSRGGSGARENRELNPERWREIVDAAGVEFREVGYAAARLQDIARRAGLTAGSLYWYIDSKEDLLYEIISRSHNRGLEAAASLQDDPTFDAATRLRVLISGWGKYVRDLPFIVPDRDLRFLNPEHRAEIVDLRRRIFTVARDIIDRGMREGTFEPTLDSAVVVSTLFSLLNAPRQWYGPELAEPFDPIYEWFADAFIRALTPLVGTAS